MFSLRTDLQIYFALIFAHYLGIFLIGDNIVFHRYEGDTTSIGFIGIRLLMSTLLSTILVTVFLLLGHLMFRCLEWNNLLLNKIYRPSKQFFWTFIVIAMCGSVVLTYGFVILTNFVMDKWLS
jgi:hypothetical protein